MPVRSGLRFILCGPENSAALRFLPTYGQCTIMDLREVTDDLQRNLLLLTLSTTAFEAPLFLGAADLAPRFFPEGFQAVSLARERTQGCKMHIDHTPFAGRPDILAQETWRLIDPVGTFALPQRVQPPPLNFNWTRKTVARLYHHYTDGRILAHRIRQFSTETLWNKLNQWNGKLRELPQTGGLPELMAKSRDFSRLGHLSVDHYAQWLEEMLTLLAPLAEGLHQRHFSEERVTIERHQTNR